MGFKSKSKQTTQENNCNYFKVGGLLFDCEDDYNLFRNIDKNISETVKSVKNGSIELKDVFCNIKNINVTELYYQSREELDDLFKNATQLLFYEDMGIETDYKVGCCFFDKINIIIYHSDSDSDSDSD